ncbi:MAG: hypothetical protein NC820_03845 [Candidatus Omnitrophica bacterium]|nr:hypothetical protein [Candidatus Omnitrophota bacterium]
MALGPRDIQIVLQVTRDIERLQSLQQQYSRHQQEQLSLYMLKNLEEKKRQTEPLPRAGEIRLRRISESLNKENPERESSRKKGSKSFRGLGENIDIVA